MLSRVGWKRIGLALLLSLALLGGLAYTQKERYADSLATLSRALIGDENTARLESWYFVVQDRFDRLKYGIAGSESSPFSQTNAVALEAEFGEQAQWVSMLQRVEPAPPPPRPAPLVLPETRQLSKALQPGEGAWTTAGLPRSTPDDVLMAKTYVRPDQARPYATVGVLLVDKRRARLHITGGKSDPGGDLGIKGPGMIPEAHRKDLLVAWNGGFRGPHGGFGMYADGKQYRPLRKGLASVVVMQDGTVRMGEWGRDFTWSADMAAVRQNAVLLVDNCEVSRRTGEGNDTWGYVEVNSAQFITWRSAIGLTREGNLLVAAGNSLSADSLARALWAAGACMAMQLDINTPYVLTSLYFPQPEGAVTSAKFMDSMVDNPARFLSPQQRDFMYLTLNETKYVP